MMRSLGLSSLVLVLACTGGVGPDADDDDTGGKEEDSAPPPLTTALGVGEGELDADGLDWHYILGSEETLGDPRDLGFDTDGNLWIANREDDRTFIVSDPGTGDQDHERRKDAGAEHFMEETAAFAFETEAGAGDFGPEFGSCGESENTYNDRSRANYFMGPVLWATDLAIFAEENPDGLGSHLDMLHESPLCVGMAWERDSVYWVFDGYHDAIVRYDFQDDHGIGQDDHSDGIVYQLSEPEVKRVEEAPGHMMVDPASGLLYVADTGNGRVLWLDTQSGDKGKSLRQTMEPLDEYAQWDNAEWGVYAEDLDRPGGLALDEEYVYVSDYGTGVIHVYDRDGNEVQSLDSGRGEGALYGIEIGPDGRLWVIDNAEAAVYRLDPPG